MSTPALLIQQGFLTEGFEGSRIGGQGKTKALDAYTFQGRISTSTDFVIGLGFDFRFNLLDSPVDLETRNKLPSVKNRYCLNSSGIHLVRKICALFFIKFPRKNKSKLQ